MPDRNTDHPLHEKLVWPLRLDDVKVRIEGVNPDDGKIYSLTTDGVLDVNKPDDLAMVMVTPVHRESLVAVPPRPWTYLFVAGELLPADDEGLYTVQILTEREL